jgi:valyl-tRNA synthetase
MDLTSFNEHIDEWKSALKSNKLEMSDLQKQLESIFADKHQEVAKSNIEHLQNLLALNHRAVMDQSNKLKAVVSRIAIEVSEGMETLRPIDLKILADNLEDEVKTAQRLCLEAKNEFNAFASNLVVH